MFKNAYNKVKKSILPLRMSTKVEDGSLSMGFSTGFVVSKNYLLTVAHSSFHDPEDLTSKKHENFEYMVINPDNSITYYEMELIDLDIKNDLGLFYINENKDFMKFAKNDPQIGEQVACYGFSHLNYVNEWELIYIQPILRSCTVGESFESNFVVDKVMYNGYSGGPYLNKNGKVVGMQQRVLTAPGTTDMIDFSLFVCIDIIKVFLIKNGVDIK